MEFTFPCNPSDLTWHIPSHWFSSKTYPVCQGALYNIKWVEIIQCNWCITLSSYIKIGFIRTQDLPLYNTEVKYTRYSK